MHLHYPRLPLGALLLLGALTIVQILPMGTAQGVQPHASVALENLPAGSQDTNNTTQDVGFKVKLTLGDMICPNPATAKVTLVAHHEVDANKSTGNLTPALTVTPGEISYSVGQGEYIQNDFSNSQDARVTVRINDSEVDTLAVSVHLTASFAGGFPGSCTAAPMQTMPQASTMGQFAVVLNVDGPPKGPGQEDGPEMPGFEVGFVLLVLVVGALFRRRGN